MAGAGNQLGAQDELDAVIASNICDTHSVIIARCCGNAETAFERANQAAASCVIRVLAKKLDASGNKGIKQVSARGSCVKQSRFSFGKHSGLRRRLTGAQARRDQYLPELEFIHDCSTRFAAGLVTTRTR